MGGWGGRRNRKLYRPFIKRGWAEKLRVCEHDETEEALLVSPVPSVSHPSDSQGPDSLCTPSVSLLWITLFQIQEDPLFLFKFSPPGSAYSRACEPVHSMVEGNNVGVLTFSGIFVVLERLDRAPSRRNSLSWRNLCNHCGVGWIILQRVLAQPQPSLLSPCHCFPRDPVFCGFIRAKEAPHPVQLGECPFQAQHPAMSGGQGGPGRVTRRLRLVGGSLEKSLWLGGELPWGSCVGRTGFTECSGPSTNWNVGLWFTLVKNVMTMRAEHWAKAGPF